MQVCSHDLRVDVEVIDAPVIMDRGVAGFTDSLDRNLLQAGIIGKGYPRHSRMRFEVDFNLPCHTFSFFLDNLLAQPIERGSGLLHTCCTQLLEAVESKLPDTQELYFPEVYADKEHASDNQEGQKDWDKNT